MYKYITWLQAYIISCSDCCCHLWLVRRLVNLITFAWRKVYVGRYSGILHHLSILITKLLASRFAVGEWKNGGRTVMLLLPITLDSCRGLVTSLYTCFPTDCLLCCTLALLSRRQQDSMQSWTSDWAFQSMQPVIRHSSAPLVPAAFVKLSSFRQWLEIPH